MCFYVVFFLYFGVQKILLAGQLNPWNGYGMGYTVCLFPLVWIVALGLTIAVVYRLA